eukprot:7384890-Prymnesium_polylepis.1
MSFLLAALRLLAAARGAPGLMLDSWRLAAWRGCAVSCAHTLGAAGRRSGCWSASGDVTWRGDTAGEDRVRQTTHRSNVSRLASSSPARVSSETRPCVAIRSSLQTMVNRMLVTDSSVLASCFTGG